jgi:hypothetical protein
MWHALSEEEREDYRQRAKDQAEVKLRDWQEKMKQFPNQGLNPMAHVSTQVPIFVRTLLSPPPKWK